jgi:hypothetical protein
MKDVTDGELFWKMSKGRGVMPAWEEQFSETQRWELVPSNTHSEPGVGSEGRVNLKRRCFWRSQLTKMRKTGYA